MIAGSLTSSPHSARISRVDQVMLQVCLALIPGTVAMVWFFGWGIIINMLLASVFAVAAEALVMKARGRPALPAVRDLSAVVTALLFAITVPPTLPWWLTLIGILFAIVIVKQLYGGIGYNPFNPAMAGYVFLLISYPVATTSWLPPDVPSLLEARDLVHLSFVDSVRLIFTGGLPLETTWDAVSGATPLDELRTRLDQNVLMADIRQSPLWGWVGGQGWEWVAAGFLLGGLYLIAIRVITWHIPVSLLGSLALLAGLFWLFDPNHFPAPWFHLFSGGAMLGAFFIATDPVSAATTKRGQLVFGALIGAVVFVIRTWGGYPDAVAFGVLLLNIAAPTIDHYTQPRVFGHARGKS
ncbi:MULTISPECIES: electron transport complex subunit RsxD [Thiorhodovibrio]|uniref:electron transport complex subunit RsxD n=1 Tax=Thiorhodovibrio TaxID=61593 RepID=UPI001A933231|nr:electron transport complex subunit RsxD [Thiorhodovibrio winogradskyi]MBK5969731.1 electron transport complex subunit RsxD [Thiorhodovibrio winogradskyi]WPL13781.1 Nitrogen fixation protein RnfD [Thiorhodovibrio litoralis]